MPDKKFSNFKVFHFSNHVALVWTVTYPTTTNPYINVPSPSQQRWTVCWSGHREGWGLGWDQAKEGVSSDIHDEGILAGGWGGVGATPREQERGGSGGIPSCPKSRRQAQMHVVF